ncbi:helix-turn-helix transcriptional regulator [Phytohabitans sp. ZYX-F-186]|uniref:Helix-turn-helix transcriptional regulator n=1 Tax=Phytohabitans maris TaxID=3071409 RepID=A0ABU0ZUQ3_9ACTN|nr:helix-turn-helix transcriptional regulator [Phytohabitans sp. ZYX-F-186]MDQ7910766.1 helix-turn-helix transcriptional regulator [Phytohabitans sp. ZYX-F-186]
MSPTIGDNIAQRRRQTGQTQEQLAEAAQVSVETIRKLEQNERTTARMATLNRIARALRVPTSTLIGNAAESAARREPDHDQVALLEVRRALTPARGLRGVVVGGPAVEPPTLDGVRARIRAIDRVYHADDYAATLAGLPALLAEARSAVDVTSGAEQAAAYELLAQAYQVAGTALIQLRTFDLAYRALSLALDAADASGNELVGASAVTTMCWLLLRQGRFAEAEQLAVTTADAIEPRFSRAEPAQFSSWGWLLLRASAAAVRDNRDDDAQTMLDAAAAAAVRIGDRVPEHVISPGPATIGAFCHTTVEMKRVESAVIAGDVGRALALAERVPPSDRPTSNNRNRHRLDVAWAHAQAGQHAEATEVLLDVREHAPAWLRHQRFARDIVGTLAASRRRAMSRELAELADLVGADAN